MRVNPVLASNVFEVKCHYAFGHFQSPNLCVALESGRTEISGKVLDSVLVVLLVLMAVMLLVFASGVVEPLGNESRGISENEPITIRSGYS
ncbi:MAG: hypothetical protein H0W49_01720 [Nitrospirales bacterium]|nr:hypothetical protein [Nitrospirales bacterium]MBA3965306.1 hypothetical protein [Nitrospirales bacterium]